MGVLVISCETTSPITSPEIIPEPEQKIIYEPKEEVQVIEEKEERKINDFTNINSFEGKKNYFPSRTIWRFQFFKTRTNI